MPGMEHGKHPPSVKRGAPGPGVVAPAFDVAALRGSGRVRLADYAGRPVVLTFWASWCISCRKEFPRLNALVRRHRGTDLAVVGITYRDIPSDSRAFAKDFKANVHAGRRRRRRSRRRGLRHPGDPAALLHRPRRCDPRADVRRAVDRGDDRRGRGDLGSLILGPVGPRVAVARTTCDEQDGDRESSVRRDRRGCGLGRRGAGGSPVRAARNVGTAARSRPGPSVGRRCPPGCVRRTSCAPSANPGGSGPG